MTQNLQNKKKKNSLFIVILILLGLCAVATIVGIYIVIKSKINKDKNDNKKEEIAIEEKEENEENKGNEEYEENFIYTEMADNFIIPLDKKIQVLGKEFPEKNKVFALGKSKNIFQINEQGQIENASKGDLPLTIIFNDTLNKGSYLFKEVKCFKKIDISYLNTQEMTDASHMFEGCTAETINFGTIKSSAKTRRNLQNRGSHFVTNKIKSMNSMFRNANKLSNLNIEVFDSEVLLDASSMFDGCSNVVTLELPLTFSCELVIEMSNMFQSTTNLKNLDISYLNTTNLEVMDGMFSGTGLQEISLNNLITTNVISAANMFSDSPNVQKIDLPEKFNVGKNATNLFKGCSNLEELNTTSIESTNIEEMESMFEGCSSISEISFSNNFLTGEVKSLNGVFKGINVKTLDLTYLRLFSLEASINIFEDAKITSSLKLGKYFTEDTSIRDDFLKQISIATETDVNVIVPSGSDIKETFNNIYKEEKKVDLNITEKEVNYEIDFDNSKWYKLYTNFIHVGMGWDFTEENVYDLDSSVVVFDSNLNYLTRVNFQQMDVYNGNINLNYDDVTGEGEGDDEEIKIYLNNLPPEATILTVQLNSYTQNYLSNVKSAYIRLNSSEESIGIYNINNAGNNLGIMIGLLVRDNNSSSWNFSPRNLIIPGNIVTGSISTIISYLEDILKKKSNKLGIDVSSYQNDIDWAAVKQSGISFVILRTTVKGGEMDHSFENFYYEANNNGIFDISGYHYSYSLSEEEAEKDANNLIEKLYGNKLTIYLDLEYEEQRKLGQRAVTDIAKKFVNTLLNNGYEANIYCNIDWYNNAFYPNELKELGCKFWIASYGSNDGEPHTKPNLGEYIWQYTSKGKVNGISGDVDMNLIGDNSNS